MNDRLQIQLPPDYRQYQITLNHIHWNRRLKTHLYEGEIGG